MKTPFLMFSSIISIKVQSSCLVYMRTCTYKHIFGYFNEKEIVQSFSNLNSFITSCIFDRHHQIHMQFDHEMSSLPDQYSPEQVISAHIKQVIIPIGTFINLRSLIIAYKHDWKDNCLIMIKEVRKLKTECIGCLVCCVFI